MLLLLTVVGFNHLAASASPLSGGMADGTLVTKEDGQQFSLPGLSGFLWPSSRLSVSRDGETITLRKGSLLVGAAGSLRIDVGDGMTVRLLAGSCLILWDERSVTVVALTAPALALRGDEIWILPGGTQLSFAGNGKGEQSAVPKEWLAQQSAKSASLPVTETALAHPLASVLTLLHSPDVIDADSLSAILGLPALSGDSALKLLAAVRLAPQAGRMDGKAAEILSSAISENVRPSQLAFAVPALAASTLNVLPAPLVAEWAKAAGRMAADDPVGSAALFHRTIASLPGSYQTAGYPKQAMLWRGAIKQVHVILSALLAGAAADQYAEDFIAAMREVDLPEGTTPPSQSNAAQQLESQFTPDQLTDLTRQLLWTKEVLLSASVSLTADTMNADCARVDGVFIAEAGHDVPYAFSYCPATQFIRNIERDSKRLPNDVPVDRFFAH